MRVAELIGVLRDFDPGAEVVVNDDGVYREPAPELDGREGRGEVVL